MTIANTRPAQRRRSRAATAPAAPRVLHALGGLLAVLAAGMWFVVLLAPGASAAPKAHGLSAPTPATTTAPCPAAATCATIPAKCPKGVTCPEVTVSPTSDLGPDQWTFVSAKNFPPGDPIYVYYCSDQFPLAKRDPDCMLQATPEVPNPQVVLTASPEGTSSISFATQEDTDDGNPALAGKVPGTQTVGSFFCDDFTNPCSIDITDPMLGSGGKTNFVLSPKNAVALPVTFAKASTGCPHATFVTTASEFGIDRIFPIASEFGCVGTAPAISINTAYNSLQAVTGMVGGADQLAFIDEPEAPDVQAELAHLNVGGKPGFALVPVALSAQVIGFKATMAASTTARIFPENTFSLTPTMVAGLITNYYSFVTGADVTDCGPAFGGQCSLLAALNTVDGFRPPGEFGGYVRSDTSSSTGEIFNWLCSAPVVPVELGGHKVQDAETAAHILLTGLKAGGAKVATCPGTDQFPSLSNTFAWASVNTPGQQALKLAGFVPPPNASIAPVAGFAPMNWSWANYFGLLPAALQNAAGKFVLPSSRSLDAAVAGAIVNKDGTLSPNFNNKQPAAYPLPDIWYAVVPTTRQSATDAMADRTLLDDVLNVTGGPKAADLPPGFVPLPKSIYRAALADVSRDIALPTTTTTTTSTTTTSTTTTTTQVTATTANVPPTSSPRVPPTTTPRVTPTTAPRVPPTTVAFQSTAFTVLGHSDSWLAPAFVSAVAVSMLLGPGLLFRTRRRFRKVV
jgi:hypothetical protein